MTRRDDEHAWLLETATRLREIGMDEAAEFLDEMGTADQLELSSRLSTIHEHLLKLAHASEHERQRNSRLWRVSVATARNAAQRLLKRNPSLRPQVPDLHLEAYQDGRRVAAIALDRQLPEEPPWGHEDALDHGFWPPGSLTPQPPTAKRRRR